MGTEVVGGAAEGVGALVLGHEALLRDTKVGQSHVALATDQHVLRLQVPGEVM